MGCDGGSIPKRNEIVKPKQKQQERDKNADLSAKWQFCALSGLRLKKPIVACQLGRLYNKDAIIEYLLEPKQAASTSSSSNQTNSIVAHIRSLKDVKELKLKEKPGFDTSHRATSGTEQFKAQFVCPISGLDLNGKYKFYYSLQCGCVLSERALKEVPNERLCLLCSKPYDTKLDLIVLNGEASEVSELKKLLVERRHQQKLVRRNQSSQQQKSEEVLQIAGPSHSSDSHHRRKHGDPRREDSKRHKKEIIAVR